jgi:hypothetical protein
VTFEAGARVPRIGRRLFFECASLSSIAIPASLQSVLHPYAGLLKIIASESTEEAREVLDERE